MEFIEVQETEKPNHSPCLPLPSFQESSSLVLDPDTGRHLPLAAGRGYRPLLPALLFHILLLEMVLSFLFCSFLLGPSFSNHAKKVVADVDHAGVSVGRLGTWSCSSVSVLP